VAGGWRYDRASSGRHHCGEQERQAPDHAWSSEQICSFWKFICGVRIEQDHMSASNWASIGAMISPVIKSSSYDDGHMTDAGARFKAAVLAIGSETVRSYSKASCTKSRFNPTGIRSKVAFDDRLTH
jgi:hypothetical protein